MPGPKVGTPLSAIIVDGELPCGPEVDALVQSIEVVGLLSPIVVKDCPDVGRYRLVAGRRRFAACKKLGWDRVPTVETTFSVNSKKSKEWRERNEETLVSIAEVDENLIRTDLKEEKRRELVERRLQLIDQLTPAGGKRAGAGAPKTSKATGADAAAERKRRSRGRDNQSAGASFNSSDGQPDNSGSRPTSVQGRRQGQRAHDAPGRPENSGTSGTAAVAGVSRRTIQQAAKNVALSRAAGLLGVNESEIRNATKAELEKASDAVDGADQQKVGLAQKQALSKLRASVDKRKGNRQQPEPPKQDPAYRSVTMTLSESPAGNFDLHIDKPPLCVNDRLEMLIHPDAVKLLRSYFGDA